MDEVRREITEDGHEYLIDSEGKRYIPEQTTRSSKIGGFTVYDTSQGHCVFCGSLTCRGTCFK
jgi:hypothetical protein